MGPLVTKQHLDKVRGYVDLGVEEGAKLVVDGRGFKLQGYEDGFFLGGCLFDHVKPEMRIYQEEIFGPVLSVVRAPDFDARRRAGQRPRIRQRRRHLHPRRRRRARIRRRIKIGMVGVNVPIPVPMAYPQLRRLEALAVRRPLHARARGRALLHALKTITARWPTGIRAGAEFVMPTMR